MPFTATHTKVVKLRPGQGGGGSFRQEAFPVTAEQVIHKGDIVSLVSGKVKQALDPRPANGTGVASGGNRAILGVAMADYTADAAGNDTRSGVTRSALEVAIFDENLEIGLRLYHGTGSLAEPQLVAIGTPIQFQRWAATSTNWWYEALPAVTTNGELEPVARHAGSAPDDDYGVMWFRVVDAAKQIGG